MASTKINTPEVHERHCSGYFIPIQLFDAIRDKKLTATEVVLAAIIGTLSKPNSHGCFASNRYLGGEIGLHYDSICKLIAHLADAGVIRIHYAGGQRFLKPVWVGRAIRTPLRPSVERKRALKRTKTPLGPGTDPPLAQGPTIREQSLRKPRSVPNPKPGRSNEPNDGTASTNGRATMPNDLLGKPLNPVTKAIPADYANASKLRDAIVSSGRGNGWSRSAWADSFRRLRERVGGDRITAALDWYIPHIGQEYTPLAFCAESFRTKFDKIEIAATRHAIRNPMVELDPKLERIVGRLKDLGWPGASVSRLAASATLTRGAFLALADSARAYAANAPPGPLKNRAASMAKQIGNAMDETEFWFMAVHRSVRNWADWSGDLLREAFTPNHRNAGAFAEAQGWLNGTDWNDLFFAIYGYRP